MTQKFRPVTYIDDQGITWGIEVTLEHETTMGFVPAVTDTPLLPKHVQTRKERFINSIGIRRDLAYPNANILPVLFGSSVTIAGDPTFTAFRTFAERGKSTL